jgi:hypothetical protein
MVENSTSHGPWFINLKDKTLKVLKVLTLNTSLQQKNQTSKIMDIGVLRMNL